MILYCTHSICRRFSIWVLGKYPVPLVVEHLSVLEKRVISGAERIQPQPDMLLRRGLPMIGVLTNDSCAHPNCSEDELGEHCTAAGWHVAASTSETLT